MMQRLLLSILRHQYLSTTQPHGYEWVHDASCVFFLTRRNKIECRNFTASEDKHWIFYYDVVGIENEDDVVGMSRRVLWRQ